MLPDRERIPLQHVPIEVIDETDPGNLLSDPTRNIDFTQKDFWSKMANVSREGFARNWKKHRANALFMLDRFDIKSRGPFLDVGFGQNFAPSRVMSEAGVDTYALDVRQDPRWVNLVMAGSMGHNIPQFFHAPRLLRASDDGIKVHYGDVQKINRPGSALLENRFGFILFNGSFSAGEANNLTIEDGDLNSDRVDRRKKKKRLTLEACREMLLPGGLIGIVSSRYAYYGAGHFFEELPQERREFIEICKQLSALGATKFYIMGMSPPAFKLMVEGSQLEVTEEQLKKERDSEHVRILPSSRIDVIKQEMLSAISEDVDAFGRVCRIDALFAQF